jgi:hypothetical protein
MFIRIVDNLQRALNAEIEVFDRENITVWLMQFSANLPLRLHHPRIGNISYQGIAFSGSAVIVFDRYINLCVEDFIEKHVRQIEEAMTSAETDQLNEIASHSIDLILSARASLRRRAERIKGRMLAPPTQQASLVALGNSGVEQVNVAARINARVSELMRQRPVPEPPPVWRWLERFASSNPALSNIISFALGAILAYITALAAK